MEKLENSSYHWNRLWTNKITNFYPQLPAARYFENFVRHRIYFNAIGKLLKNISLRGKNIIELGSGTGSNSLHLARTHSVKEVTLVDFSEKALARIKADYFPCPMNKINKDIFEISSRKEYDFVHSTGLIEHFKGEERFLAVKKHTDFIRDGGLVMIWVPVFSKAFKPIEKINKILGIKEQPFTRDELRFIFKESGLEIINEGKTVFGALFGVLGRKKQ
jgi:2-polyprenyl-3-methyl-5-hydroxy-6-metoxy-1,4-benzoquinol methylase